MMEQCGFVMEGKLYSDNCNMLHMSANNWPQPHEYASNCIVSSLFDSLEWELRPKNLGLKYVVSGQETYYIQGKRYEVSAGKYLLVNQTLPSLGVVIKDPETMGMCVNIEADLVNDVLAQLQDPDNLDTSADFRKFWFSPELFIKEVVAGKEMQAFMQRLTAASLNKNYSGPPLELVYELTCLLIRENLELVSSYFKLSTSKTATRKELFHRLLTGKEVLEDSVFSEVNMKQVAEASCLSEFHFYRLFRQCFGLSPYNFLFRKRIEKSIDLKKQDLSWNEIAFRLNFTDLAAFSKGFKKVKGVSPTKFAV